MIIIGADWGCLPLEVVVWLSSRVRRAGGWWSAYRPKSDRFTRLSINENLAWVWSEP